MLYGRVMNIQRLKQAEKHFYTLYPGGFADPKLIEIGKKHRGEKMHLMAGEAFAPEQFDRPRLVLENMVKIISRSSMVSLFEKPKFRDLAKGLVEPEVELLTQGLYHFLHGRQAQGFEMMLDILAQYKLAKWTLLTIIPAYYHPEREVYIKPTTVKRAIRYFELTGLPYKPRPTYAFYTQYRAAIQEMKKIAPVTKDNAAFGGFIMITTPEL